MKIYFTKNKFVILFLALWVQRFISLLSPKKVTESRSSKMNPVVPLDINFRGTSKTLEPIGLNHLGRVPVV